MMPAINLPLYSAYWVVPNQIMAGEYPGHYYLEENTPKRIDALLEAGITTFIDLTMPNDRIPYEHLLRERAGYYQIDIQYHRFAISDFATPAPETMRAVLDTIYRATANGGKVYIHCSAGIGRTGTAVGCFFVEQGMNSKEALKQVNKLCYYARSPENARQKQYVRDWVNSPSP